MSPTQKMDPVAFAEANGVRAGIAQPMQQQPTISPQSAKAKASLEVKDRSGVRTVYGRLAQTLSLLIERGADGLTSGDASVMGWARRTSAYIHQLRCRGFQISTTLETTGDGSRVGRYHLIDKLEVLSGAMA